MRNEQANTRKQFKSVSNPSRGLGASAGYGATSGRFKDSSVSADSIQYSLGDRAFGARNGRNRTNENSATLGRALS